MRLCKWSIKVNNKLIFIATGIINSCLVHIFCLVRSNSFKKIKFILRPHESGECHYQINCSRWCCQKKNYLSTYLSYSKNINFEDIRKLFKTHKFIFKYTNRNNYYKKIPKNQTLCNLLLVKKAGTQNTRNTIFFL